MCKLIIQKGIFFLTIFLSFNIFQVSNNEIVSSLLCSEEFCNEYKEKNKCPPLPPRCSSQNPAHNGIVLPSVMPCNCCPFCVDNLDVNEDCSIGSASGLVPNNICGPQLFCSKQENAYFLLERKCIQMTNTKCTKELQHFWEKFEDGTLGNREEEPNCDKDGNYAPYKCILGEICYCVDEDGKRIFGEIPYTTIADHLLKCECSRHHARASKILDQVNTWSQMKCTSDGSFDKIQCIDDDCYCVDPSTGDIVDPNQAAVNITEISKETLPCFDNKTHIPQQYYRECEEMFIPDYIEDHITFKDMGIQMFGFAYPECRMDGHYDWIQENATSKFCANIYGVPWKDYVIEIDDIKAGSMNCECAKSEQLMTNKEMPQCCPDGNYNKMQCTRGECRCVDQNGNQIVQEVDYLQRKSLPCYNNQC